MLKLVPAPLVGLPLALGACGDDDESGGSTPPADTQAADTQAATQEPGCRDVALPAPKQDGGPETVELIDGQGAGDGPPVIPIVIEKAMLKVS